MLRRFKQRENQSGGQGGFTIIEVLIVLAIAGLIMVVVFLAVPHLQESQRNNARDTDANNLVESVSEYVGNAGGAMPAACASLAKCTWITYKPQQLTTVSFVTAIPGKSPGTATAYLIGGATCNGVTPVANANTRDYVVWYGIEGSTGTKCTSGSS